MHIVSANVARAVIDAQLTSATYPGHVPARWALPLLDALDTRGRGWQLVELDEEDLAGLWLPAHAGEPCHGDAMPLGDDADGAGVRRASEWLARHAEAYAAANPSCWSRITHARATAMSPIIVSPESVGDRVKPDTADLVVVDGLHRALAYWMAGHRRCLAYIPGPPPGPTPGPPPGSPPASSMGSSTGAGA